MKILDLDLPDRVKRCLIRSRIETLEQLLELKCDDLMKIRNLGRKSCTELMAFLEYNRLQLKDGRLYFLETREYHKRLLKEMEGKPVISLSYDGNDEEEVTIVLPKWAIEEMNDLINGEYGKNRGFKMTYSDLIQEMIANFKEWPKKRKTPVLGASLNENEETPDPYEISQENEVLCGAMAILNEKLKYLTEKCAEQKEVLEIFAERLKFTAYPMDDVFTFEVSRARNPNEFDVIAKWLK